MIPRLHGPWPYQGRRDVATVATPRRRGSGGTEERVAPGAVRRLTLAGRSALVRFIASTTISMYGDWMTTVAVVVVLYRTSGADGPAAYILVRVGPRVLGAQPGGYLSDRLGPARAIVVLSLLQAFLAVGLAGALQAGAVPASLILVGISQAVGAAVRPAQTALIPRLVDDSHLPRANALYLGTWSSSLMVGPAIATPLIILVGPAGLVLIDAVSFVVVAAISLTLTGDVRPAASTRGAAARDGRLRAARFVWIDRRVRILAAAYCSSGLIMTTASACFAAAAAVTLGGAERAGWLYASAGVGSVAGSALAAGWRTGRTAGWRAITLGSVCELGTLVAFVATPIVGVGVAALAVCGASSSVWESWGATALQRRSGREFLGRTSGIVVAATYVGMIAGALIALGAIDRLGWRSTILVASAAGALLLLFALLMPGAGAEAHEPVSAGDGLHLADEGAGADHPKDGVTIGGLREQVPLPAVAAHGADVGELLLGLDPFGDSVHVDRAQESHDGERKRLVAVVGSQTADEGLVDLDDVDR